MRLNILLRAANTDNVAVLKQMFDKAIAEAPQYLSQMKKKQKEIVYDKVKHLNRWYTRIIGLDEVKVYQERVTALQDQLLDAQNKRRELMKQLSEIRIQANDVQSQIQNVDRKENFNTYCKLINDEKEIFDIERSVTATFQQYDQAERDLFTAFTNAVRDSQEKQRSQMEYSKYIGLVLSLIGSFLAFVYTFFWKQDLKMYINQQVSSISPPDKRILTAFINDVKQIHRELEKTNTQLTIIANMRQISITNRPEELLVTKKPTEIIVDPKIVIYGSGILVGLIFLSCCLRL